MKRSLDEAFQQCTVQSHKKLKKDSKEDLKGSKTRQKRKASRLPDGEKRRRRHDYKQENKELKRKVKELRNELNESKHLNKQLIEGIMAYKEKELYVGPTEVRNYSILAY